MSVENQTCLISKEKYDRNNVVKFSISENEFKV